VAEAPCPCGSAYLKVADVLGRADEVFVYPGGISVHPLNFRSPLGMVAGIVEYQVWQTEAGAAVAVVSRGDVDLAAVRGALVGRLAAVGVRNAQVAVRRVERIERQGTGKLRRFVPLPPATAGGA